MWPALGRLILGKILSAPELKTRLVAELKAAAAKSDTTIDDEAVKIVSEVWDVVIPLIIGKVK